MHRKLVWLFLLNLGLCGAAAADDWPQLRQNAARTAAYDGTIQLPMVPIWSWHGAMANEPGGRRWPLVACAIWQGRAFFVGAPSGTFGSAVYAADARTGAVAWARPIAYCKPLGIPYTEKANRPRNLMDGVAYCPVVTGSGLVLVADHIEESGSRIQAGRNFGDVYLVYRAADGALVQQWLWGQVPHYRLTLTPQPPFGFLEPMPTRALEVGTLPLYQLGYSAVEGDQVVHASPTRGYLSAWLPGVARPPAVRRLRRIDRSWGFSGPPSVSAAGIVTAEVGGGDWFGPRTRVRFPVRSTIVMLDRTWNLRWHRMDLGRPGHFTLAGPGVYTRMSGGIIALDAASGGIQWTFPPGLRPTPAITDPSTFFEDSGLAVAGGRLFGEAGGGLVALNQQTGELIWRFPLGENRLAPSSVVASREYVFASGGGRIFALRVRDGSLAWEFPTGVDGSLALAHGMLYFATGTSLHLFAPAERLFRVAADSDDPGDYSPNLGFTDRELEEAAAERERSRTEAPPEIRPLTEDELFALEGVPEVDRLGAYADAAVLRLSLDQPEAALLRQARARREAARGVPLLMSLEWLDPQRTRALVADPQALAALCGRLAAAAGAEWVDVAPEVNVYLLRRPEEAAAIGERVALVAAAVREAAPGSRLLVSVNLEVLAGIYGRGRRPVFGPIARRELRQQPDLRGLVGLVDAVGLTSHPQSGYREGEAPHPEHFLAARALLPATPLLITRASVHVEAESQRVRRQQMALARGLAQLAYWLDAELVVYPEVTGQLTAGAPAARVRLVGQGGEEAPVPPPTARVFPAAGIWADVPHWRRVEKLSAGDKLPPLSLVGRRDEPDDPNHPEN
jgi:hypothetical protein